MEENYRRYLSTRTTIDLYIIHQEISDNIAWGNDPTGSLVESLKAVNGEIAEREILGIEDRIL